MESNGKDQHDNAVEPVILLALGGVHPPPGKGHCLVGSPHEYRSQKKAQGDYEPGVKATGGLGPLNGGLEQRPEAGGDHHPGGKAQHRLLKPGLRLPGEKKYHGGAQGGHQEREARAQGGPAKRPQHTHQRLILDSGGAWVPDRPYASISGEVRSGACFPPKDMVYCS